MSKADRPDYREIQYLKGVVGNYRAYGEFMPAIQARIDYLEWDRDTYEGLPATAQADFGGVYVDIHQQSIEFVSTYIPQVSEIRVASGDSLVPPSTSTLSHTISFIGDTENQRTYHIEKLWVVERLEALNTVDTRNATDDKVRKLLGALEPELTTYFDNAQKVLAIAAPGTVEDTGPAAAMRTLLYKYMGRLLERAYRPAERKAAKAKQWELIITRLRKPNMTSEEEQQLQAQVQEYAQLNDKLSEADKDRTRFDLRAVYHQLLNHMYFVLTHLDY